MHWDWYDIVFILIALWVISDLNKPKAPKPPKAADLFSWRPKPTPWALSMRERLTIAGCGVFLIAFIAVFGHFGLIH